MTLTQAILFLALIFFGPLFGCGVRLLSKKMSYRKADPDEPLACFFTMLLAYGGWLFSGLYALARYPDYPYHGPGEKIAILYALPGFIGGGLAIALAEGKPYQTYVSSIIHKFLSGKLIEAKNC